MISNQQEYESKKEPIREIAEKNHNRIDPKKGEKYDLYSFSAYDDNQQTPIETHGSEINSAKYVVPSQSVLISKLNPRINRVWKVEDAESNAICSTEFIILQPRDHIPLNYVYAVLNEPSFRSHLTQLTTGTSGSHQRVKQTDILDYEILKFDKLGKKVVSSIYGALDKKIEINNQINRILEEMAQALFKSWFVDFDPYEEFKQSELGKIPKEFNLKDLVDIADVTYGYAFSSEQFNEDGNGIPVIRIRNIPDDEVGMYSPESFDDQYIVQPGDVLAGMDGEFRPHIWKGPKAGLNQRVCRFKGKKDLYSEMYLWNAVMKPLYKLEKSKTGTTVIHLGKRDIDNIRLPVPDEGSLRQFNTILSHTHDEMLNRQKENRKLEEMRDTLLPKLMSGEIRVNDLGLDELEVDNDF